MIRAVLFVALMSMLVACSSSEESAAFESLPINGWAYGDELVFADVCADSVAQGKFMVAVRHTDAYLYSNLWLELTNPDADGNLRKDTLNVILADTYGNWRGKGSGVSYVAIDTLDATYFFDSQKAPRLRHIMRVDTLKDVEQIGLVFIKQ